MKRLLACLAALFGLNASATVVTMGFEPLSGDAWGALVSDGFVLDPGALDWTPQSVPYPDGGPWTGHYHIADPSSTLWDATNGTKFFVFDYFLDNSVLNIRSLTGGVFGVGQMDLAEAAGSLGGGSDGVIEITFTGYLAGGGTISRTEKLDMVRDGAGPLQDFETFTFDAQWSRLTLLTIVPNSAYANLGLDNLVLNTVPEPGTLALAGLAVAGLAVTRRRRR